MNRLSIMYNLKLFVIFFGILCLSCEKEYESPVPDYPVNLSVRTNNLGEGESKWYPGGYGGVIIYCMSPGNYYAYDACCTHELIRNVVVEPDGALAICNACGSKYILIDGGHPAAGPSKIPLKQFRISEAGGVLRVWN